MPSFGVQSLRNLATVDPRIQRVLHQAILVFDFSVVCGHRSEEEQMEAYNAVPQASKKPWPESKHNTFPSKAVDVAPWSGGIDWEDTLAFARLYGVIEACAYNAGVPLRWGGDWDSDGESNDQSFMDIGHFEIARWSP